MCLSRISAVSQTDGLNAHEFLKAHHHQTGPGRNRFPFLLGGQKISGPGKSRKHPHSPPTPSLSAAGRRCTRHASSLPPLPARTRSRAHATEHPHPRNPAVSSSSSPAAAAGWGADPSSAPRPIPPSSSGKAGSRSLDRFALPLWFIPFCEGWLWCRIIIFILLLSEGTC